MSGSGISSTVCRSAPRPRQITMPESYNSVFTGWMPFLPPQPLFQDTLGKPSPERETILDFKEASDDRVAVTSAEPYADHLHLAQDR